MSMMQGYIMAARTPGRKLKGPHWVEYLIMFGIVVALAIAAANAV